MYAKKNAMRLCTAQSCEESMSILQWTWHVRPRLDVPVRCGVSTETKPDPEP